MKTIVPTVPAIAPDCTAVQAVHLSGMMVIGCRAVGGGKCRQTYASGLLGLDEMN